MKITAMEDGPNKVELEDGEAWRVTHADGQVEVVERTTIFLCRCGQSAKKPFCDGTHRTVEFRAPGVEMAPSGAE